MAMDLTCIVLIHESSMLQASNMKDSCIINVRGFKHIQGDGFGERRREIALGRTHAELKRWTAHRRLFDRMSFRNVVSWAVMINGYVENEMFQSKDRVSFNAMITGYAQNGIGEEALRLYSEMLKMGMQPDQKTLVSVFTACSDRASLQEGNQTHVFVIRNGFETNVSVCNAMVTMYSKCGSVLDSELAFTQIHSPDLVSWNTIIAAFAQHDLYEMLPLLSAKWDCTALNQTRLLSSVYYLLVIMQGK